LRRPRRQCPPRPLPDAPFVVDSAEQRQIRVSPIKGLSHPWSLTFLPGGEMLVTERPGRLRIVRQGVLWLRYRDSPFEPAWDAFDVSGPQGVKFDPTCCWTSMLTAISTS